MKNQNYSGSFQHELDVDNDKESFIITLDIEYSISAFVPGKHTLSNGDPGYPDEGNEIEDLKITFRGKDFSMFLTDLETDIICEACYSDREFQTS